MLCTYRKTFKVPSLGGGRTLVGHVALGDPGGSYHLSCTLSDLEITLDTVVLYGDDEEYKGVG